VILLATLALAGTDGFVDRDSPMSGDPRTEPIRNVVVHATGGPSCDSARAFHSGTTGGIVKYFQRRSDGASIHYVVGRDGEIVSMVPEDEVAGHVRGHNQDTIGIELVNDGDGADPFATLQLQAASALVADLLDRYELGPDALVGHTHLDTRHFQCQGLSLMASVSGIKQSQDPGAAFPWDAFRPAVQAVRDFSGPRWRDEYPLARVLRLSRWTLDALVERVES
jgi:N-acetylmuramoyl-L-alanine amidase